MRPVVLMTNDELMETIRGLQEQALEAILKSPPDLWGYKQIQEKLEPHIEEAKERGIWSPEESSQKPQSCTDDSSPSSQQSEERSPT